MRPEREAARLRHNETKPVSLGCIECPDYGECGGLQLAEAVFDCASLCVCDSPRDCQFVCRRDPVKFVRRVREVGGFGLGNVPRAPTLTHRKLPGMVPLLYHGYRRKRLLKAAAVAIRLADLYEFATGRIKFKSKKEVAQRFRFDPSAKLVVIGIDKDRRIEPYWGAGRAARVMDALTALEPDVVTTPNFSLFINAPRYDNLHSIKRIAICWQELVAAGVPTSLHVNARTPVDWQRWTEFVAGREEVCSVSFEFLTGAAVIERGTYHARKLCDLASAAGRPLQLVTRGGRRHLDLLRGSFDEVVLVDSGAFVKAVHRRLIYLDPAGVARWGLTRTEQGHPIDHILQHNVDLSAEIFSRTLTVGRAVSKIAMTNPPYMLF